MRETQFKIKVIKYLKSCPDIWFAKLDDRTHKGYPDIIGLIGNKRDQRGVFFAIELKVKNNKPDPLQCYTLFRIQQTGGVAFWSKSLDEIKGIIENLRKRQ